MENRPTTLASAALAWIADAAPEMAIATASIAELRIRVHINPYFGETPITDITQQMLQGFIDYKADHGSHNKPGAPGLARNTVFRLVNIVRRISVWAIGLDEQAASAIYDKLVFLRVPLRHKPEPIIFEPDEINAMIDAARPHWMGDLILLGYTTGMRRGEMFGLQWDDIDFERSTLYVRRSVAARQPRDRIIKDTKTPKSMRSILLDAQTVAMLRARRGKATSDTWVFASKYGELLSPWYVTKYMHDACVKAGVKPRGIHVLRHTHASMMLAAGVPILTVSRRLGHSNAQTTLQIYGHVTLKMQKVCVDIIPELRPTEELKIAN